MNFITQKKSRIAGGHGGGKKEAQMAPLAPCTVKKKMKQVVLVVERQEAQMCYGSRYSW